jgi:hypothetical protein
VAGSWRGPGVSFGLATGTGLWVESDHEIIVRQMGLITRKWKMRRIKHLEIF